MSTPSDKLADAVTTTESVVTTSRQVRQLLKDTMDQLNGVIQVLQEEARKRHPEGEPYDATAYPTHAELSATATERIATDLDLVVTAEERVVTDAELVAVATERVVTDRGLAATARERVTTDTELVKTAATLAATVTALTAAMDIVNTRGRWNRAAIYAILAIIIGGAIVFTVLAVTRGL